MNSPSGPSRHRHRQIVVGPSSHVRPPVGTRSGAIQEIISASHGEVQSETRTIDDHDAEEEEQTEDYKELRDGVPSLRMRTFKNRQERMDNPDIQLYELPFDSIARPPSFAQSEFETIVRRLRNGAGYKKSTTRLFPNNLDYEWQFAGWGTTSFLNLDQEALDKAKFSIQAAGATPILGQSRATSISGNAVWGSVFYALPAICSVADIYSPLCMLVACMVLFLFKPILLELGSAMRLDGANYVYMLNCAGKSMALIGATATLIDAVATGVVSAATAASYINGEVKLDFPPQVMTIIILVGFVALMMLGLKESSGVALTICAFHCLTMIILAVAAVIHWARSGPDTIKANWANRPANGGQVAKAIFDGICIGLLGVTGFESAPAFIAQVKPSAYQPMLRNLVIGALAINIPILLLTYGLLSQETILSGANVLAVMGEVAAGRWMRKVVVVDSVIVLCGGVMTGAVTTCTLIERLSRDRAVPQYLSKGLPITGALWAASGLYLALCLIIYSVAKFDLASVSNLFSMAFMGVLLLFSVASLLLKFNRDRLKRNTSASIAIPITALIIMIVVMAGNIAQSPSMLLPLTILFVVIYLSFFLFQKLSILARWSLYVVNHLPWAKGMKWVQTIDAKLVRLIKEMNNRAICVWVKTDDISALVESVLYVKQNEQTARIILIHAYQTVEDIPSELQANTKLVDEAFPGITVDLVLVHDMFSPCLVEAVSQKLEVRKEAMFIGVLDTDHAWDLASYHGVRVING